MLVKTPIPGSVKTRLVPPLNFHEAAALALAFATDMATRLCGLAPTLGAELFVYYSPADAAKELHAIADSVVLRPQEVGDLGCRMRAIVADLRAKGFAHVVLVGADIPTLPNACISTAFEALDSGAQVAIARADDGGYVLLGVDDPHGELFESIPWSTSLVYETTVIRARAADLAVRELPGWYDMDTVGDLARLRRECATGAAAQAPNTWRLLKDLRL